MDADLLGADWVRFQAQRPHLHEVATQGMAAHGMESWSRLQREQEL